MQNGRYEPNAIVEVTGQLVVAHALAVGETLASAGVLCVELRQRSAGQAVKLRGIQHGPSVNGDETVGSPLQLGDGAGALFSVRRQKDEILIPPARSHKPVIVWSQHVLLVALAKNHGALRFIESHEVDPGIRPASLFNGTLRILQQLHPVGVERSPGVASRAVVARHQLQEEILGQHVDAPVSVNHANSAKTQELEDLVNGLHVESEGWSHPSEVWESGAVAQAHRHASRPNLHHVEVPQGVVHRFAGGAAGVPEDHVLRGARGHRCDGGACGIRHAALGVHDVAVEAVAREEVALLDVL
mmetsp:Transcript_107419/g.256679  ORF Transcript_107419/g.256679 Transcript_107419/m.256679 type:complete len:301 (+) Transcript_107419:155-1057(+)